MGVRETLRHLARSTPAGSVVYIVNPIFTQGFSGLRAEDSLTAGQTNTHARARLNEHVRVASGGVARQHTTMCVSAETAQRDLAQFFQAGELGYSVPRFTDTIVENSVHNEADRTSSRGTNPLPNTGDSVHRGLEPTLQCV